MRLSTETRYAIAALIELAVRPPGELVESLELARTAGLPGPFLAKALQSLARAGILRSVRGRGYALARSPGTIRLAQIVAAVEDRPSFGQRCAFWRQECSERDPCVLHWRWRELRPAIEGPLAATTLEEIVLRGRDAWLRERRRSGPARRA